MDPDDLSDAKPFNLADCSIYSLDEQRNVVLVKGLEGLMEAAARESRVASTYVGDHLISTVFIPRIRFLSDEGEFAMFETMVFDGERKDVEFTERSLAEQASIAFFGVKLFNNRCTYRTWADAEKGHQDIVRLVASVLGAEPREVPKPETPPSTES